MLEGERREEGWLQVDRGHGKGQPRVGGAGSRGYSEGKGKSRGWSERREGGLEGLSWGWKAEA